VWSEEKPLTLRGMTVMKDIFEKCDTSLFQIHMSKNTTDHTAMICKKSSPQREYSVVIPKGGLIHGSRFGTCSCGYPKKEGVPCNHMVAIVKVSAIATLTRVAIMPYWFTKAQWRLQFPEEVTCATHITLTSIKTNSSPTDHLKYCPAWTAGQKKGRPKKQQCRLGITDHIQNLAMKRQRNGKKRKDAADNAGFQSIPEEDEIEEGFDLKPARVKDQKEADIGSA
jgi:hypothetical protein